jgi:hypothetical protein
MDVNTTTNAGVTIKQLQPYLEQSHNDSMLTNALLILLVVFLILGKLLKYINSWFREGF